jgi:hypothetical protein
LFAIEDAREKINAVRGLNEGFHLEHCGFERTRAAVSHIRVSERRTMPRNHV